MTSNSQLLKRIQWKTTLASALMLCLSLSVRVSAQSDEVSLKTSTLPPSANFLAIFDFESLGESEWAKNQNVSAYDLIDAHSSAKQYFYAGEMDFEYLTADWQIVMLTLPESWDFNSVRESKSYRNDRVAGQDVVWLNDRVAATQVSEGQVSIVMPVSRQSLSKYIRNYGNSTQHEHSPYLEYAEGVAANDKNVLTIVVDLRDAFDDRALKYSLSKSKLFTEAETDQLAELFSGIDGVSISATADRELLGTIKIKFNKSPGEIAGRGKELIISTLDSMGASLPELNNWNETLDGTVLEISGRLSRRGLENLASLAQIDHKLSWHVRELEKKIVLQRAAGLFAGSNGDSRKQNSDEQNTTGDKASDASKETAPIGDASTRRKKQSIMAEATEDYLDRMRRLLQVLDRNSEDSMHSTRLWLNRTAFRIQYLDRENVDEELIDFADQVTNRLMNMSEVLENANVKAAEEMEGGWTRTPTWRTINYGGIRIRRSALFYSDGIGSDESRAVDQIQAADEINDGIMIVKVEGIAIVRDYNEVGEVISDKYDFDFERWTPGGIE